MAFLEQFSTEDRDLIVSIPYRAGVWVSMVDDDGGGEAEHDEIDALENILAEKARGMFESAFVHEVMAETASRQQDWPQWAGQMDTVLADCTKAVGVVGGKLSEKDLDAYRMHIMAIGLEVAKAFREFDVGMPLPTKLWTNFRLFMDAIVRVFSRDKSFEGEKALNISYEEDQALSKLSQALHPGT